MVVIKWHGLVRNHHEARDTEDTGITKAWKKGFPLAKRRGLWIGNITNTFATQRKLLVEEIFYEVILCREDTW